MANTFMKNSIISTIKMINNNANSVTAGRKEEKTTISEIYNNLVDKFHIISDEEYLENIFELERDGTIFRQDGKCYGLKVDDKKGDDNTEHKYVEQNYPDDVSLIEMIKANMLQDRLRDQEYINFLKEQIKIFKANYEKKIKSSDLF